MSKITTAARILLGAVFTIFGLNGFLRFFPTPVVPGEAGEFLAALARSGYLMPLAMATEVAGGVLVLTGVAVPFALGFGSA